MISRRYLFHVASLATAALGGGGLAAPARGATGALRLGDLAGLPAGADAAPRHIAGQGWFEPADPAGGEADGILRIAGADGRHWLRSGFAGALDPGWFRQPDDGPDDALAIQRACDHAARFGPFAVELGSRRYLCRSALTIDPVRVVLRGSGAVLDFSSMPEPPARDPVMVLSELPAEPGWRHEGGAFHRDEAPAEPLSHFLSLPEPGRYRITVTVGALSGSADYPAIYLTMNGTDREPLGGMTMISPGRYDFEVEGPQSAAKLSIETDCAVRIDRLEIQPQGRRECVLIQSGEESPQYGHLWMEGVTLAGPGQGTALHGMRFETLAEARSSRLEMRNVSVAGFETGLIFSHRAYLIRATGLRCACEGTGLHFLAGLDDAGELISLYGSTIEASRVAIRNNGGELAMFGTAIDFVDQVFVGTGRLMLRGCHLETNRPKAADLPLFDLGNGDLSIESGSFMVTGSGFEHGNQCDHIFELRSRGATAMMRDVSIYNLRSQSGALAGGPGRLDTAQIRGGRPRHMAPVVQFSPERNLLGPLPHDLRGSDSPSGDFTRLPADGAAVTIPPEIRHVWLFAQAVPGAELGVAFRIRSENPGNVWVVTQALDGAVRLPVGDHWLVEAGPGWNRVLRNTGPSHPSARLDGRVPDGFPEIALKFDLSELEGAVELADIFLCAC